MRKNVLLPALAVAAVGAVPATAMAEATANIGWVSDYIFRGIFQEDSSAYAGVDLNHDTGFYIGAWGADVGTGNELDYYLGWEGGEDFTVVSGDTTGDGNADFRITVKGSHELTQSDFNL